MSKHRRAREATLGGLVPQGVEVSNLKLLLYISDNDPDFPTDLLTAVEFDETALSELAKAIAAQLQLERTCAECGHLWESHNQLGCCWDDDCTCNRPRRSTS